VKEIMMQKMKAAHNQLELVGQWLRKLSHQLIPNIGTLVLVALLLFAYHAWAAPSDAPQAEAPASGVNTGMLSYQGYLTDAGGEPLDGEIDFTFRLYSTSTGGTALWTEAHTEENAVPADDGLFNVMLGSLTPIPNDVWSSGASYLGIQVGNDAEMSPREAIGNVPTALTVPDGSITMDKLDEQPYYFHGAFATPSEWMADVIWNGNYARFCKAIGRTYVRAELLQEHFHIDRGVGYFYEGWYYTGRRFCDTDTHIWGNGDSDNLYNVWQYNGDCGANIQGVDVFWTRERSAIIWCE
jgi:hypothetical protein